MNCIDIRSLLSTYLDGELEPSEQRGVRAHLDGCEACRREVEILAAAWDLLGELDEIEPNPNYISLFCVRLAESRPWYAKWARVLSSLLSPRRLVPIMAAAGLIAVIGVSLIPMRQQPAEDTFQAAVPLNGFDPELFESYEIADHFELINELDLLSDMEIIQGLEWMEAS